MTNDETGIDKSAFLAKVAARKKEQANQAEADLSSLVGYSTGTPALAPPPVSPKSNGAQNGTSRRQPPRIPSLPSLGLKVPVTNGKMAEQLRRDADEMFEDFHSEKSELDRIVDDAIAAVDVIKAYRLWIRKMDPRTYEGQTESIMISCPVPGHEDSNPSAWINTEKGEGGLWHCGACARGGDKYDLAAIGLGYDYLSYKTDGSFRGLKLDMARSLGVDVDTHLLGPAAKAYLAKQNQAPAPEPTPAPVIQSTPGPAPVPPTAMPRVPAPIPTQAKKAAPPVVPGRRKSNEEILAEMHAGASRDWDNRLHKYYPPKEKEKEEKGEATERPAKAKEPPAPAPVAAPPTEAPVTGGTIKDVTPPAPAQTAPAPGSKGAMPQLALTGLGLGMPMAMPNGKVFVNQPVPKVDINDPGMVKALLEDEGIKTDAEAEDGDDYSGIKLDFRTLVPENTFLGKYCSILMESDSPDEWNFWNAIAGLSVAVGKRINLRDRKVVHANVYICLMAETTAGKSRAKSYITRLLRETLPWVANDPDNTSPRIISGAASGEYLITKFRDEIRDPANPRQVLEVKNVSGLVEYDEFATIMAKASGMSSNFVPTLQALFDGYGDVESGSFTTGDKLAVNPFASMLTSTQPSMIQRLIGREHIDNGFMNRFIFAPAVPKELTEEDVLGGEDLDVGPSGPYLKAIHEWSVENAGNQIQWGTRSLALGREFLLDQVVADKKAFAENKLIQRSDLLMKKLMMLFTLNRRESVVPVEAVESAMKVYPYLMESYSLLDRALTATESSELRNKIIKQVGRLTVKNGKPPTKGEIHDALGRQRVDGEALLRAIKTMCEIGDLKEIKWPLKSMPQVGRPSVRYGLALDD